MRVIQGILDTIKIVADLKESQANDLLINQSNQQIDQQQSSSYNSSTVFVEMQYLIGLTRFNKMKY